MEYDLSDEQKELEFKLFLESIELIKQGKERESIELRAQAKEISRPK